MYTEPNYVNGPGNVPHMIRVYINGSDSFVPIDPANGDYRSIMKLVEEGKLVIEPADNV